MSRKMETSGMMFNDQDFFLVLTGYMKFMTPGLHLDDIDKTMKEFDGHKYKLFRIVLAATHIR
jgi:hypothetical protein